MVRKKSVEIKGFIKECVVLSLSVSVLKYKTKCEGPSTFGGL